VSRSKTPSTFHARVTVMPRRAVLDPQGRAIHQALKRLGFKQVEEVRAGKSFDLTLTAAGAEAAAAAVEEMCRRLLANPVIEDFAVELVDGAGDGRS